MTGHPVVAVPMGRDSAGVPFGLQIVAPRWRDGMALALAEVIEQAAPWPLVADGYDPFPGCRERSQIRNARRPSDRVA